MECGAVRPLAAVLVEPLIRGKVKDCDTWSKHSRVVCDQLLSVNRVLMWCDLKIVVV